MLKYSPVCLFIGLFIGFLIVYLFSDNDVVLKYPSKTNPDKNLYIDDNGVCYRYKKEKIKCLK